MERTKNCKCGNIYTPYTGGQVRCIYCILESEPHELKDDPENRKSTEFVEWFIYHWHNIRKSSAKAKGVPFEWDDNIYGNWKNTVKQSDDGKISKYRLFVNNGIAPATAYSRLRAGWTMDEVLAGKRKSKGGKSDE